MAHFLETKMALQEHAQTFWGCSEQVASQIELSKIDVATDMKGSFLPDLGKSYRNEISQLLSQVIEPIFKDNHTNFLSLSCIDGLRVT